MGAISARTRQGIKKQVFSLAKEVRKTTNFFGRNRRKYLTAVVEGDWKAVRATEATLIERLRKEKNKTVDSVLSDNHLSKRLVSLLRLGIPLSNALKITVLGSKFPALDSLHLPHAPKYRKPEVLASELEIIQLEYESLRLARKQAEKRGLSAIESKLRTKIASRAKLIATYKRIFSTRLVE